jgi:hypothetical protein
LRIIRKPITALAILTLVEDGLVALSDPVARHLPAFDGLKLRVRAAEAVAGRGLEEIRAPSRAGDVARDLLEPARLGMGGGYPESMKDLFMNRHLTLKEAVECFASEPLEAEPGARMGLQQSGNLPPLE